MDGWAVGMPQLGHFLPANKLVTTPVLEITLDILQEKILFDDAQYM